MQELISLISAKAGINTEQATKALEAIKDFVIEKFPMMSGVVDNLFQSEAGETDVDDDVIGDTTVVPDPAAPATHPPSMLDKISDVIPGQAGQKVEDFVKGAAHKAGDAYESVKEKLGGAFGGDKK